MGWIKISETDKKSAHKCILPMYGDAGSLGVHTNDLWECDVCEKKWMVTVEHDQRERPDTWFNWRQVTVTHA